MAKAQKPLLILVPRSKADVYTADWQEFVLKVIQTFGDVATIQQVVWK